jgi:hypothetical protein
MKALTQNQREWVTKLRESPEAFHPLKGPMLTQTLQDIIGHEPFHWRGDRAGIEEFSGTFRDLQGTDDELTKGEIAQLKAFLKTISFPPNPNLMLNGNYSTNVPLPGFTSLGRGVSLPGTPLPNGNASRGRSAFTTCASACHTDPSGLGVFLGHSPGVMDENDNTTLRSAILERSEGFFLKVPQLRNLLERTGFSSQTTDSTAGFGFTHDGRVDTLERFLQEGTDLFDLFGRPPDFGHDDQALANMIAFLVSASSSQGRSTGIFNVPPTQGAHPAVGRQFPLSAFDPNAILQELAIPLR